MENSTGIHRGETRAFLRGKQHYGDITRWPQARVLPTFGIAQHLLWMEV